jgi:hypothetical protein
MDWQQIVALVIVAVTAALFIRARLRRRKGGLPCGSQCGSASNISARPTVVYHARKGERPKILVKMK